MITLFLCEFVGGGWCRALVSLVLLGPLHCVIKSAGSVRLGVSACCCMPSCRWSTQHLSILPIRQAFLLGISLFRRLKE